MVAELAPKDSSVLRFDMVRYMLVILAAKIGIIPQLARKKSRKFEKIANLLIFKAVTQNGQNRIFAWISGSRP